MFTTKQKYQLKKLVETQRFTKEEIALILGSTPSTVYTHSRNLKLKIPTKKTILISDKTEKVTTLLDNTNLKAEEIATKSSKFTFDPSA